MNLQFRPIFGHSSKSVHMRFPVFAILVLLISVRAVAQDLHYSQFYHNPVHFNPALTGVFRGDMRASALYRSQWTSVPVSYRTFSGAADWKVIKRDANLLSVGFNLQHDRAGDAALTWTQVGATAGVAHALGEKHALSAGVGLALAQRSFDISKLKFRNQWTGEVFDPTMQTGESFNKNSGFVPTLSAGLDWHFEPGETRTRLDAGIGAFHLNRPKVNFRDDADQKLPMRFTLMVNGAVQIGEMTDLVGFGVAQRMSGARETIAGAGVRRVLSTDNDTAVQFSVAGRFGDALIPAFQVEWSTWTVGVSYDWNTSDFDIATGGRGGFEVAVVYRATPVPPVKTFKACPIF